MKLELHLETQAESAADLSTSVGFKSLLKALISSQEWVLFTE